MSKFNDLILKILLIALSAIFWAFIGFGAWRGNYHRSEPESPNFNSQNSKYLAPKSGLVIIGENTLKAVSPVYFPRVQVLGVRVSPLLYKIIDCESDFRPYVCNKELGCNAGMGLAQLIPKTVRYCEEKLGKRIDPFDPKDNIECASWLLENEGTRHWGTAETWWGTYDCWKKYLDK